MKYTMINGTADGQYQLLCFHNDICVCEKLFDTVDQAHAYADRFLNNEFKDGFK